MSELNVIEDKIKKGKRLSPREVIAMAKENQRLYNNISGNDTETNDALAYIASKMYLPLVRSGICEVRTAITPVCSYRGADNRACTKKFETKLDINNLKFVAEQIGLEILIEVSADLVVNNGLGKNYVYFPYVPLVVNLESRNIMSRYSKRLYRSSEPKAL